MPIVCFVEVSGSVMNPFCTDQVLADNMIYYPLRISEWEPVIAGCVEIVCSALQRSIFSAKYNATAVYRINNKHMIPKIEKLHISPTPRPKILGDSSTRHGLHATIHPPAPAGRLKSPQINCQP